MSVDLSRPLVSSMGQHDALDGYVRLKGEVLEAALSGLAQYALIPPLSRATDAHAGVASSICLRRRMRLLESLSSCR